MKKIIAFTWVAIATISFIHIKTQAKETDQYKQTEKTYQNYLSQAHNSFSQQHYNKALTAYKKSYAIEPLDSTLYNIAVTHFKLKQWQMALDHFEELKIYQGSTDLVEYNIAVAHKKLNQQEKALTIFNELVTSAESEKIALLADQQIEQITHKKTNQNSSVIKPLNYSDSQWQNMLRVQYGKDNNIILPGDDTNQDEGDKYIDLSFNTTWMSSSDLSNAWMADFTYFKSKYSEASDYNIDLYALSARKYFTYHTTKNTYLSNMRFWLGLSYDSIKLAGNNYINNTTFTLGTDYKFNAKQKLTLEISNKNIKEGDDQYNYLAGDSNRFKLTWRNTTNNGYWRAGVKYYLDDRNDRITEDTNGRQTFNSLTSYSADRTTLFINRLWNIGNWELGADLQYRYSAYNNANTFIEYNNDDLPTGTTSLGVRKDDRYNLMLELAYNISDDFSIGGELDLSTNSSTIENYDYNQSSFAVGVNWVF